MCISKTNNLPKFYKINTTITIFCLCLKENTPKVNSYKLPPDTWKSLNLMLEVSKLVCCLPIVYCMQKIRHLLQFSRCPPFFKMAAIYTEMYDHWLYAQVTLQLRLPATMSVVLGRTIVRFFYDFSLAVTL